jgi:frataxin-like iron-binding protein CyaY
LHGAFSGPKRFEYDHDADKWVNTRDGECLIALLKHEFEPVLGLAIDL